MILAHVFLHNYSSGFFSAFSLFHFIFSSSLGWKMHFGFSCARLVIKTIYAHFRFSFTCFSLSLSLFASFSLSFLNVQMIVMVTKRWALWLHTWGEDLNWLYFAWLVFAWPGRAWLGLKPRQIALAYVLNIYIILRFSRRDNKDLMSSTQPTQSKDAKKTAAAAATT